MEQHIPQDEIRRIIISDMVKKKKSIVPVIGEDTIVYKDDGTGKEIPFEEYILLFSMSSRKRPFIQRSEVDYWRCGSGYHSLGCLPN